MGMQFKLSLFGEIRELLMALLFFIFFAKQNEEGAMNKRNYFNSNQMVKSLNGFSASCYCPLGSA